MKSHLRFRDRTTGHAFLIALIGTVSIVELHAQGTPTPSMEPAPALVGASADLASDWGCDSASVAGSPRALLVALAPPVRPPERLQTACDFLAWLGRPETVDVSRRDGVLTQARWTYRLPPNRLLHLLLLPEAHGPWRLAEGIESKRIGL